MVSFIILLIARTARIARPDRQTERQNDRQNDKPSTVTLAAHARRGLITQYMGVVHARAYACSLVYRSKVELLSWVKTH